MHILYVCVRMYKNKYIKKINYILQSFKSVSHSSDNGRVNSFHMLI